MRCRKECTCRWKSWTLIIIISKLSHCWCRLLFFFSFRFIDIAGWLRLAVIFIDAFIAIYYLPMTFLRFHTWCHLRWIAPLSLRQRHAAWCSLNIAMPLRLILRWYFAAALMLTALFTLRLRWCLLMPLPPPAPPCRCRRRAIRLIRAFNIDTAAIAGILLAWGHCHAIYFSDDYYCFTTDYYQQPDTPVIAVIISLISLPPATPLRHLPRSHFDAWHCHWFHYLPSLMPFRCHYH